MENNETVIELLNIVKQLKDVVELMAQEMISQKDTIEDLKSKIELKEYEERLFG